MYGSVFLSQGLTTGSSFLFYFILYSFLFAGSVDEDHERDSLSALCSYKSPESLISIYVTVLWQCASALAVSYVHHDALAVRRMRT